MQSQDFFSKLSKNEIKRKLDELDKLDLKNESFENVFNKVIETFNGVTLCRVALTPKRGQVNPEFGIFRAREFSKDLDLNVLCNYWEKPARLQSEYGRCHTINESRFYASNYFITTLHECRAKPGTEWMVAEFEMKENAMFESVFLGEVGAGFDRMIGHKGVYDSFFLNTSKSDRKKNTILIEYMAKKLGEKVNVSHNYKLTAAISKFVMKNFKNNSNVECIIYPSLMSKKKVLNFAIEPVSAREKLRIIKLHRLKIEAVYKNGKIDFNPTGLWNVKDFS